MNSYGLAVDSRGPNRPETERRIFMQEVITRAISTGVYVITVRTRDRINGMTAAWVMQLSFNPAMIAVSIAPARYTHDLIKESGYFCVNALPKGTEDVARHFGFKTGRKTDKFKGITYTNALNGSPVLDSAYIYLECKLAHVYEIGDHSLFLGSIVDIGELKKDAEPLIFRWESFFGKDKK